jgi:hypothetical protein
MRALLTIMAAAETTVGLCLIAIPATGILLLLGSPLETAVGTTVARVTGIAMLALGIACWFARADTQSLAARGVVSAMLIYNAGVCALLVYGALSAGLSSFALWPVAISHAGLAAWCLVSIKTASK